jgi:hypothetical protein
VRTCPDRSAGGLGGESRASQCLRSGDGARPTFRRENGSGGGFRAKGSKSIIPALAHSKVSSRLVPTRDPERLYEQYQRVRSRGRSAGRARDRSNSASAAGARARCHFDHPAIAGCCGGVTRATFWPGPIAVVRGRGSIPVAADSASSSDGGPGSCSGSPHYRRTMRTAPNESMDLNRITSSGIRCVARLLGRAGRVARSLTVPPAMRDPFSGVSGVNTVLRCADRHIR